MSKIKVDEIGNLAGTESIDATALLKGSARSWLYADTSATVTTSFNVSSGVDTAVGWYNYSHINVMVASEVVMLASVKSSGAYIATTSHTGASVYVYTHDHAGGDNDRNHSCAIWGSFA